MWRRSSRCDSNACVEVAHASGEVLLRDSKDPDGPRLSFAAAQWSAFLDGVKDGQFDP